MSEAKKVSKSTTKTVTSSDIVAKGGAYTPPAPLAYIETPKPSTKPVPKPK